MRDPNTKQLVPPEGIETDFNMFWCRRQRDGDLDIYDEKPPAVKPAKKPITEDKI